MVAAFLPPHQLVKPFISLALFQLWKDYEIATARHKEKSLLLRLPFKPAVYKTSFPSAVASYLGPEREEEAAVTASREAWIGCDSIHITDSFSYKTYKPHSDSDWHRQANYTIIFH